MLVSDFEKYRVDVTTQNTIYTFWRDGDKQMGVAKSIRPGESPNFLGSPQEVVILGGYDWDNDEHYKTCIEPFWCMRFSYGWEGPIRTSRIQSIRVSLDAAPAVAA